MRAAKIWSDEADVNDFSLRTEVGHLTTMDSEASLAVTFRPGTVRAWAN
jgi:hypothetical protein